jgi:hypothetical protein
MCVFLCPVQPTQRSRRLLLPDDVGASGGGSDIQSGGGRVEELVGLEELES